MFAACGRRNNTFCVSDRRKQSVRSADCEFSPSLPSLPASVGPCPPHPSSFGHFLPLSGRYAAISNELRVRKIYKTSEQLASYGETACYLAPPPPPPLLAMCAVRGTVTSHARPPARSLPRNSSSCFIFLFPPRFPLSEVPPPVSEQGRARGLAQVGRSFRTRR